MYSYNWNLKHILLLPCALRTGWSAPRLSRLLRLHIFFGFFVVFVIILGLLLGCFLRGRLLSSCCGWLLDFWLLDVFVFF
jgi:hypothetical protein